MTFRLTVTRHRRKIPALTAHSPFFLKSSGMMNLQIRRAELRDLSTLVDFNRRLAWETERLQLDVEVLIRGVTAVLEGRAEAHYLVAEIRAEVVGQLMLTREWSDWRNGWFYWIQSVYVAPEHRGRGVFRALYNSALQQVEQQPDAVGLRLYVEQHNTAAEATYLRLGMQPTGYKVLEHPVRNILVPTPMIATT